MHAKNEIVAVARGFYAMPILNVLARRGVLKELLAGGVTLEALGGNLRSLRAVMTYLANLGWVDHKGDVYTATPLGRSVLSRSGAFAILYSYRPYVANLDQILFDPSTRVDVHRDENVVGSGEAHIKKYFSRVRDLLARTEAKVLVDIGCGDGTFLAFARSCNPSLRLVGVDFSERALDVTRQRLAGDTLLLHGNVSEPLVTLDKLGRHGIDVRDVWVSVWFIFHEVLGFPGIDLVEMLKGYRKLAPRHGLLIGEIFDVPSQVLAQHHNDTAIPEFNLFHDLSGQKLFSLEAWQRAMAGSGFSVERFIGLDELAWPSGPFYGSAVWSLR